MAQLDRTHLVATATTTAVATTAAVAAATIAHLLTRRAQHPKVTAKHRHQTLGCEPDDGPYLEARLSLPTVDGANQGIALSMLRDLIEEEGTLPDGYQRLNDESVLAQRSTPETDETDADIFAAIVTASGGTATTGNETLLVNVPYHEGLRSAVEVVITVAMTLAMHDIDIDHECHDDECEASNLGPQAVSMWHTLQTSRRLLELATAYEKFGADHARECRRCRRAAHRAPLLLRARLCRDIADDMVTNEDDNSLVCDGVPVNTALDVARHLVELIEEFHGIPAEVQLTKLSETLAGRISLRESGLGD